VDARLAPLLQGFRDGTTLVCADHGECWGEDGLWEHGISHPATLTVPLLLRYRGQPVGAPVFLDESIKGGSDL
jgi:glucan phosphoethanolaminetransferase (alkaline phosphatase superfamily)